ncbi:MAG: cation:proton antiporter [Candidatus Nanoarchaeia archaeon]|nr:cation:proton antiporter [Candidatus Nanoarchaeia archaeon]MDD5239683.1 cation:proton antiporter [Candidatus Nanoarchaeia archaeon]
MALETVLIDIALLLVAAKVLGELCERIGYSSIIGEVLAGILLGPSLLNVITPNETMSALAGIGILLLMFIIGLSAKFEEAMENNMYRGALIAILGGSLSFALAFVAGIGLGYSILVAVTVGAAITSTAMGISLRTITEIGKFYDKTTKTLIAANVADDIFSIIVMSLFVGFVTYSTINFLESWKIFLIVIGFFIVLLKFGGKIAEKIMDFTVSMKDQESMIAIPVVIMFLIALLSQQINIAGITGAFLAGIILAKTKYAENTIMPKAKTLGYGFLIPLFFAYTGVNVNIFSIGPDLLFLVVIFVVAIVGKLVGTYVGSRMGGYEHNDSLKLGFGMIPRAEYTLAIGQLALGLGAIGANIFTLLVVFVLGTTIATPVILRFVYEHF